jgi:predicted O-methyltransferase YrrM
MVLNDEEPFDFIYIDGSHQAADVLLDACLAFKLLRKGGVLCFDDYTWKYPIEHGGILMSPKMGIDSFLNVHHDQVRYLMMPLYQLFIIKV